MSAADSWIDALNPLGLNLHGFLSWSQLSPAVRASVHESCTDLGPEPMLWVIAHQGQTLWRALEQMDVAPRLDAMVDDPLDTWVASQVTRVLQTHRQTHRLVFPSGLHTHAPVPLQQLGRALGWHHTSPFQVGIDAQWGSWFAYRAVVALPANAVLPTPVRDTPHPCDGCASRACERACPAQALTPQWSLQACMDHRLGDHSSCAATCQARDACPVGAEHRYGQSQMAYHYGQSLRFIRQWRATSGDAPSHPD